ncbi:cytokine receptor common subunit beta-like [Pygocentrus nattereri]|uniref:cytokine receptor common subunit beta-like n=1 Tax=Pygocentrus nattereri TaxID=42514 RepID=UPI0018918824|nr:cytokine receptor common subunit beta-like [Pygocentrus nattereri]
MPATMHEGMERVPNSAGQAPPPGPHVSPCVRGPLLAKNALGQLRVQCRYNTSLFAIGFDDVFFFHTPHSPGLSRVVNLKQHARRPRPHDPHVNITDDGGWTHTWLDPKPSLTPTASDSTASSLSSTLSASRRTPGVLLTYQPSSGRPEWMPVEMERSEPSGEDGKRGMMMMEDRLKEERRADKPDVSELVSEYEARGWSPLLSRKTDTDNLSGPFNLHCVYDGESEVRCSWEMKRELTQFILYNLSYRTHPHTTSHWCCAGLEEGRDDDEDDGDDDVRFSCSFSVSEAELLLLDLRPQPRTSIIQAYKHIEPGAPVGLSVELIGEDWVLNWTLPKYRTVPIASELRYWSANSPEDVETLRLLPGVSVCVMAERSLISATHYLAQVRCIVSSRTGRGARYAGYPSDWSEPVHWTTRPAPASGLSRVYFLLAVSVSITVILTYFTLLTFHRKVKVWEVSLPSPFQSKALKAVCQTHGEWLSSYTEVDDPCISEVCVLGDLKQLNLQTLEWEYEDATAPSAADSTSPHQQTSQEEGGVTGSPHLTEHNQAKDSVPYPTFPACSSVHQGLMGIEVLLSNSRFMCLTSNFYNEVQPCSEGYQQKPGSSGDAAPDVLLDTCLEDVEMHDGYMDCPK